MRPAKPLSPKAEITRTRLIVAAASLFREDPTRNPTSRDISARADVTDSLISYYFSSLNDLLVEARCFNVRRAFQGLTYLIQQVIARDPAEVRANLVEAIIELCLSYRRLELLRLLYRMRGDEPHPKVTAELRHGRTQTLDVVQQLLDHVGLQLDPEVIVSVCDGVCMTSQIDMDQALTQARKALGQVLGMALSRAQGGEGEQQAPAR